MKNLLLIITLSLATSLYGNDENTMQLDILNITAAKGTVYVSIFDSASNYQKKLVCFQTSMVAKNGTETLKILLAPGTYLFSIYQDINSNKKLDANFFGYPTEPVALSNWDGRSIPWL